jgi:hypothetical protein
MIKRKQYIIDKEFQMKQTFSILGIKFVIVAILIVIIGVHAALNNRKLSSITKQNDEITKSLDEIMIAQDNIVETEMAWINNPKDRPNTATINEVAQKHYKNLTDMKENIRTIQTNISNINNIIKYNNLVLLLIIIIVLIQSVILYAVMIRKTHKISGPIYVIKNYMKEIIDGKFPTPRPLRKDDEFQDFYEIFKKMIEVLKEKETHK